MCIGMDIFFWHRLPRIEKKKYENESDRGIVDWTKKKIVPRSAINYVLFSKSNQGHPDDKRCNKYTLFKDILDTANCLIS